MGQVFRSSINWANSDCALLVVQSSGALAGGGFAADLQQVKNSCGVQETNGGEKPDFEGSARAQQACSWVERM